MPIGIIANCLGVIIGGILGSLIGPRLTESFKANLNLVLGACAMTMGISSICLMKNMLAVILAVILGTVIGLLIYIHGTFLTRRSDLSALYRNYDQ